MGCEARRQGGHFQHLLSQLCISTPNLSIPGGPEFDVWLVNEVRRWGVPNAFGAKIQLQSCWNFPLLESLATSVSDRETILFLRYGWPLNYTQPEGGLPPVTLGNHGGGN